MPEESAQDPNLEEALDRALARLGSLIPASKVEELRKSVRFGIALDPRAQEILRRLGARPHVKQSGTVSSAEVHDGEEADGTRGIR